VPSALRFRAEILYVMLWKIDGVTVVVTGQRTGRPRNHGLISDKGKTFCCSVNRLWPTTSPVQWIPVFSRSLDVKLSVPLSAETGNEWSWRSTPTVRALIGCTRITSSALYLHEWSWRSTPTPRALIGCTRITSSALYLLWKM
jgi:hypothetical protein